MSDSFYKAVRDEKYLKESGEWDRRKQQDEKETLTEKKKGLHPGLFGL